MNPLVAAGAFSLMSHPLEEAKAGVCSGSDVVQICRRPSPLSAHFGTGFLGLTIALVMAALVSQANPKQSAPQKTPS